MFGKTKAEKALVEAQNRVEKLRDLISKKGGGAYLQDYKRALEEKLCWEREVAAERNEEYAVPINFSLKWDGGAPSPYLVANDDRTFLTFILRQIDPNWDGKSVTTRDLAAKEEFGLVEFEHCSSFRFGSPNDEVWGGHPLANKGQEGYGAQQVINSKWLAELEKINSVHHYYSPESWKDRKHFIFWFHDNTFECIAKSFKVETFQGTMRELLFEISCKLLGSP